MHCTQFFGAPTFSPASLQIRTASAVDFAARGCGRKTPVFRVLASMRHFDIAVEVGFVTGVMPHTGPTRRCASIVYEEEREVIATYVSTCGLQRQSHKGKLSSNEVFE